MTSQKKNFEKNTLLRVQPFPTPNAFDTFLADYI